VAAVRRYMIDRLTPEQLSALERIGHAIVEASPPPSPCDGLSGLPSGCDGERRD